MTREEKQALVSVKDKTLLTVEEASAYSGLGQRYKWRVYSATAALTAPMQCILTTRLSSFSDNCFSCSR